MADSHEVPNWETFLRFLGKRCQVLENLNYSACFDSKLKLLNATATDGNVLTRVTERGELIPNFISQAKTTYVLLSIASIYVKDNCREYKQSREILDSASQGTFIANDCATFLELKINKTNVPVGGLNCASITVGQQVTTELFSKIVIL
ncbi:hypothetical protein NPIL_647261 [Nephila pilipes]|uniref:Uncharacterized protein n=1 Tax=Nephila pilipes TaxID=299642 RepID=A0A8X6MXW5_NEPPI|nr:hypothetical protein NPIL_647261 [Nephila pilipes]